MSITRLQQARQMYAMGQRVGRAFGGVMGSDGRRQYGGGSDMGASGGYGYQGGGTNKEGTKGTGPASSGYSGGNTPSNDGPDNSPNIHTGPTYSPPTTNIVDEVALTGFGTVPGVDYSKVGPGSTMDDNRIKAFNLLNSTYKPIKLPPYIPGSTLINTAGNFLGNLGYKKNTQFFAENVAGKYGYGYGLDDYKQYMQDRMSGKVGAYGNENMGQNAINERAGDGGGEGIMSVAVDDTTDDTTTEDELLLRFLGEDSTLDPTAAGVANTDELRAMILERAKNLYT